MYIYSLSVNNTIRGEYMKKKLVLKPFVLPTIYITLIVSLMILAVNTLYRDNSQDKVNEFISEDIFDETIPVINTEENYVLSPYRGDNVTEKIGYYNYQSDEKSQEKSIIQYENTYLQNSGITYSSENEFDVIAIMDGKVTKIYDNELLGTVIEVTHNNNVISVYQTINNTSLKQGDEVTAGTVLGQASVCKIFKTGYNLHFEIIKDGLTIDPNTIIGKNIKEI